MLCVYRRIEGRLQATHVANKNHSLPFLFLVGGVERDHRIACYEKGTLFFFFFLMFVCLAKNRTK